MSKTGRRLAGVVSAIGAVIMMIVGSSPLVAAVRLAGWWAYPIFTLLGIAQGAVVFLCWPLVTRLWPSADGWIKKQERRLAGARWQRLLRYGPLPMILVAQLLLGPMFSAVAIRFVGYSGRTAWAIVILVNLIGYAVHVLIFLKGVRWLLAPLGL